MTVASAATSQCKKAMKIALSLFSRGFSSSKCKTMAKMAVARIKLLRNKRQVVVRQMRRDIAMLLESRQDATARVRVEHVIREQNIMAANEFLELFCELIVARLPIISKQRECPADLKEGISSLIFAAPRCSDIPELMAIKDVFEKKYGKDFVSAATDLRPNAGVNRTLIEKLSVKTPSGEVKLKVMKEIAKEYQVDWDTTESETELLKPPEERIDGPTTFVSATSFPTKPVLKQTLEPNNPDIRSSKEGLDVSRYDNPASAAEAAAESAKQAIAAAQAAAYLANQNNGAATLPNNSPYAGNIAHPDRYGFYSMAEHPKIPSLKKTGENSDYIDGEEMPRNLNSRKINRRHSYNVPPTRPYTQFEEPDHEEEVDLEEEHRDGIGRSNHQPYDMDSGKTCRRHSYNAAASYSGIKFDESDCDEDIEMEQPPKGNLPPNRPAPQLKRDQHPRIHPKLPDYDTLAARFEALKYATHKPK